MLGNSTLGYDLIDFEGIHYHYCINCYDACDPWFQYQVADILELPFTCEGCNTYIGEDYE